MHHIGYFKDFNPMKLSIILVLVSVVIHSLIMGAWLWMGWNPIVLAALLGADKTINNLSKKK
jgi:hypothetical protein